jgi:DNA replication protein DnaC
MKPGSKAYEQFFVDDLNKMVGNENEKDGYNCNVCKNKGWVAKLASYPNGTYGKEYADCKCLETRRSIMRMKRSGLKDIIKDYTFDKFDAAEPWQKTIKSAATDYAKSKEGWFYLGGQSGCGKTHLCTAICREFLLEGKQVVYMMWRDDIAKIKGLATFPEERQQMIDQYKNAEVLYIDDLFKTGRNTDGSEPKPTAADINAAFEIINYRYNNSALLTIISSELNEDELLDIDEAVGGRIFERSKSFSIAKDRSKNYRIRRAVTL